MRVMETREFQTTFLFAMVRRCSFGHFQAPPRSHIFGDLCKGTPHFRNGGFFRESNPSRLVFVQEAPFRRKTFCLIIKKGGTYDRNSGRDLRRPINSRVISMEEDACHDPAPCESYSRYFFSGEENWGTHQAWVVHQRRIHDTCSAIKQNIKRRQTQVLTSNLHPRAVTRGIAGAEGGQKGRGDTHWRNINNALEAGSSRDEPRKGSS